MKDFRDELLEYLFAHSGESMDIKYLTDKYCGEDDTFDTYDETKSRCRLRINRVLRELKDMGWIDLYPQGGMSTAHSYNPQLDKRQFIMDVPVTTRLTTKGEIEYKKMKQEPMPHTYHDHSIKVQGDLTGIANTGEIKRDAIQGDAKSKDTDKKNLRLNKWMVVLAILAIVVTIVIYLLQRR